MKKLFLSAIIAVVAFTSIAQVVTIPGTNYPFYSDIIKFKQSETYDGFLEIYPIDKYVSLTATPPVLNEKLVQQNLLKSLNALRKQYGRKPLKLNTSISSRLNTAMVTGNGIGEITWTTYASFNSFNYVRNFQNKEEKFCDYLFDVMSVTPELFLDLIDSNAKEVGFYYNHNTDDKTYDFVISIK